MMLNVPFQAPCLDIYKIKYQLHDFEGNKIDLDMDATFQRVANKLASVEKNPEQYEDLFYTVLKEGFIPAGRILANAGAEKYKKNASSINCVVSGEIEDSISGIFNKVTESAISLSAGCGIGYCFSSIRPKGAFIHGVGATTGGVISFMDTYNTMCFTIASSGGRRGAQMATLHVWHPQIEDFITAKHQNGQFRQFNFSTLITEEFMSTLAVDGDWKLYFPLHKNESEEACETILVKDFPFKSKDYVIKKDQTLCKVYKTIKASYLWDLIMKSTYEYSEPGVLFIDNINKENPLYFCETITATNPCGEQPLPPYGACLLGSLNLTAFLKISSKNELYFDLIHYRHNTAIAARMLDNVVEISNLPLQSQSEQLKLNRRHGMGYTGLGSTLNLLNIPYGSSEAEEFTSKVTRILAEENFKAGVALAKEKEPAPIFNSKENRIKYVEGSYISRLLDHLPVDYKNDFMKHGSRWSHGTSIAPTGTISFSFGNNCSNGIEPTFLLETQRNVIQEGKKSKAQVSLKAFEVLAAEKYDIKLENVRTANDIKPIDHITIQAAAQQWIDSSISKTVNVPQDIKFEDFKKLYIFAYGKGLKGCTTYRYNPTVSTGVLVDKENLDKTTYKITLSTGETLTVNANDSILYENEIHVASNLCDAIKEGYYGKL